jgi:class 3 adenylate cyclase/tetratricopeptide (TPR) repeat protein
MEHIFISHVEEDAGLATEIAGGLEGAGYRTWYYQRDTVPGASYLTQINQAIERAQAVVLVISPRSVDSKQVTKEVINAFEKDKPFLPVLRDITHVEFQRRQPEWAHALAGSASIGIAPEGVSATIPRIVDGLKALGIKPGAGEAPVSMPEPAPPGYPPKHLADKIIAARSRIEGERKQVTVLFAEVTRLTSGSGALDPEEAQETIRLCLDVFREEIYRYEGTVAQFIRNGVMALFGAPIAHEDAPQRALSAALSIQGRLQSYAGQLKGKGIGFELRIGVNTGLVVVGKIGDDLSMEYTAVGDTVDLAAEIEGLAEPGTIYVTGETFRLTEVLFRFEALGEVKVKGREGAVKAYRLLAPSTRRTRFDVSAERGLTPFVGRERERELLLDGFERARAGRGQAFSIVAEAGMGKSRLLYEFRKAIANEEVSFLEGKCLSYSRGMAYYPLIEFLKSSFDIQEGEGDEGIREKVGGGLKAMGIDEGSTLPYLLELLSVKESGIDRIPMSPEARKDRIIESIKRIVLKGSELRPLVLAIEDLHWMDRSSEEALKYVLNSISGARVLLIFTYRPEFVHTWGGRSYHNQVNLNRLSNRESLTMVSYLLGTEEIEQGLEELILEKTEGVPFFIEEFIRSLKDLKIIERRDDTYHLAGDIREMTIPSTIQDVIMARVDMLPEAAKGVLQTGSVIEREFSYELIQRVAGLAERELLSHLSVLKDSELLYERGIYPQSSYIFKHALTREVVYDSILTKRKKRLHGEIGDVIEEIYRDNLNEHYEALAGHYLNGENYQKGAEYCKLAGSKAEDTGSLTEAIAYGEKRVSFLERLPRAEDVEKRIIDARTTLGLYCIQIGYHVEARDAVDPIVDSAVKRNYKKRVSQIYTIIGAYYLFFEEEFPRAFKYLDEALKIAEESNDILSLAMASYWLGLALAYACEFEKALYHCERVLEINAAANNLWGMSAIKSSIAMYIYGWQGEIDLAYQTSEEAIRIAEESGDIYSKGTAYSSHGFSCYCKGFLDEAEGHLLKGAGYCEGISFFLQHANVTICLGEVYSARGEYQKAKDHYDKAISLLEHGRLLSRSYNSMLKITIAGTKVMNNEKDIALNEIFECYEDNRDKRFEGLMLRGIAGILLNIDDQHLSEAEDWIKKAIEADKRNGTMLDLGMAYTLYAELLKRIGELPQAKENLNKSIGIYKECGADGWLKRAEETLADLG